MHAQVAAGFSLRLDYQDFILGHPFAPGYNAPMMDLLAEIKARAQGLDPELTALRRDLHQHPELTHQEERTGRVVAKYLRELGLTVQTGLAGHGVLGVLQGARPGRAVAWRADMDALPITEKVKVPWHSRVEGVMHACGHDFHVSIGLGAARLLSEFKDRLAGEFRFIFQPAEEGPPIGDSGAKGMVAAGVMANPAVAAVCALHVAPNLDVGHIRYGPGVVMAGADRIILTVTGKSAHGATPHRGVDPIWVTAQVLNLIQGFLAQQIDSRSPKILTFGRIQGGNRFNILADEVELEGSLRYLQESVRQEVLNGLRRQFAGLSQATGAEIKLTVESLFPMLKNSPELTAQAVQVLQALLGAKRLKLLHPAMGSEDFPYYASMAPGFYFFLGVRTPGDRGQALHSPHFNPDEGALPYGLMAAAGLLACLSEPKFPVLAASASPMAQEEEPGVM
ncbi:MAG: M20 family metallopeptidase [Syntrophobacterales bacterium]|nr:M20 family metallopeptidase [Syntrophobacterales bacterium]